MSSTVGWCGSGYNIISRPSRQAGSRQAGKQQKMETQRLFQGTWTYAYVYPVVLHCVVAAAAAAETFVFLNSISKYRSCFPNNFIDSPIVSRKGHSI